MKQNKNKSEKIPNQIYKIICKKGCNRIFDCEQQEAMELYTKSEVDEITKSIRNNCYRYYRIIEGQDKQIIELKAKLKENDDEASKNPEN